MMNPIQFQQNGRISLNRLRLQIDRRVNVITMMVNGIRPKKISSSSNKVCAQKCCEIADKCCQTEEQCSMPLHELPQLSLSNTPSIKSLKSPTNTKKSSSTNKQNHTLLQSASSMTSKPKPLLISIQQSQQQGLKTSRYLKNLQSQKKKIKPLPLNIISTLKKSQKLSCYYGSNVGKRQKTSQVMNSESKNNNNTPYVVNSFDSTNRKKNLTDKKSFKASTHIKPTKQPTTQQKIMNFSFNSSIPNLSQSKSKLITRKGSITMNDISLYPSSNHQVHKKHPTTQSFSTTFNLSSAFTTEDHQQHPSRVKRMTVSEQVMAKIQLEFEKRLQLAKKKTARQPKPSNNNIRVSLLKRLEDKHIKAHEVTK